MLLTVASLAVGFAAIDTYVVVLALPDMMASVGLNLDQLQRAAPIVSGFLLGYIAVLPLIGRIADVRGRVPVLAGSLVVFSVGSLVTAASYNLGSMVTGRFLQGIGAGGLVPATLALVAEIWSADARGVPLGVVGAVQELGSVLGPLYGAAVLALSSWHTIFWLNLAIGLILAATLVAVRGGTWTPGARHAGIAAAGRPVPPSRQRPDLLGGVLAAAALTALALVLVEPGRLTRGLTTGLAFVPYVGETRWSTPVAAAFGVLTALFVARELTAQRPLVVLRDIRAIGRTSDLPGAVLLGLALAGIVLAFTSADPQVQVFSSVGPWSLACSALAGGLLVVRLRMAPHPLIPPAALREPAAWGSIVVSFFVGAALIAALVDIPVFARLTTDQDSQLGAALVLVRLLAALPVGALVGGYLTRRRPPGFLAAAGMLLASAGFVWMTRWGAFELHDPRATIPLVACGLGFGIAIAPINTALLGATESGVHGLASSLAVVARMVGMLIGISILTTVGLHRFYDVIAQSPSVDRVCPSGLVCHRYVVILRDAGIAQVHAIFWGAGASALVAGVLALVLLSRGSVADSTTNEGGGVRDNR